MAFGDFFKSKPAQSTPQPQATPPVAPQAPQTAPAASGAFPWGSAAPAAPAPAQAAPVAPAAPAKPSIDLAKRAPGLVDLNKKAGISLQKRGLSGEKFAVYMAGDHSGSMGAYYRNGTLQRFAERVLAMALEFDDDGSIPVVMFDTYAHPVREVTVDDYQGAIDRMDREIGHRGTTNYAAAMQTVIDHYQASGSTDPAFVVFQTDGSPDNQRAAEKILCKAASLPIFWAFVGFGRDSFTFLRKLDDLAVPKKRVIDNASFFEAGVNPDNMDAGTLYDNLIDELPEWLAEARRQGIVR